jgi:hypothetical protein
VNEEELDDVEVKLRAYQEFGPEANLTDWERGFADDQLRRYELYGPRARFSEKQLAAIDRIYNKLPV